MTTHHLIELVLYTSHVLGIAQHKHIDPLQCRLDGLHAGREQIDDHLHKLFIC